MYRLLIVDDEEDIRRGLAEFFPWDEIGFEVTATAENGKAALEIVRTGQVDVVFCDIRMPGMSGLELARSVFEAGLRIPVVFLSAYRDFAYAQQAMQYGVRGYVLKPTNYPDIRETFAKLKREMDSELAAPPDRPEGPSGSQREAVIAAIRRHVERDYARATLRGAARVVHLNPQYVSRIFKEATGENFHAFLNRLKMEKAARLLRQESYLTYEIGAMVGYSNQKNFTRAFKQFFGVSPREYRRSD